MVPAFWLLGLVAEGVKKAGEFRVEPLREAGINRGDGLCWNQREFEADEEHGLVDDSKTVAAGGRRRLRRES